MVPVSMAVPLYGECQRASIIWVTTCANLDLRNEQHHPGPGVHRHHAVDAGRRRPRVPATSDRASSPSRSLLPQPRLRQLHRHRQAAQLQWLDLDASAQALHVARRRGGLGKEATIRKAIRTWCANRCTGDVPTMETIAAAWLIRQFCPDLKVRVGTAVLFERLHPHGLSPQDFVELFTADSDVTVRVPRLQPASHAQILHGRSSPVVPRARVLGAGHDHDTVGRS